MLFNEYTIIKNIGMGLYSKIYQVSKIGSKDVYTLNQIEKKHLSKNYNIAGEINILKDINHPNIVKLIDFKEDPDNYYIITEFCNGGTLETFLNQNQNPLSEEQAQYIMKQVINIIEYLNEKKIVHRDLCTDNLLINFESENDLNGNDILKAKIKLTDFGLSTYLQKGNLLNDYVGNIKYVAPEIFRKKSYDEKIDIWSLGVLCSKLLIRDYPYDAKILRNDDNVFYYLPESLSKEAVSFINCMLQYDPNLRKSADNLAKHEFLTKNVKNFNKIKIDDIKEHIEDSKIKIHIKDNKWVTDYFGWGISD